MRSVPFLAITTAVVLGLGGRAAIAEDDDPLAGLSGAKILEHAKVIASDAMKGRKTGFEGGRLAEEWMQSKLGELGVDPMDRDGIYLQSFSFGATAIESPIGLTVDGAEADYGKDYVDLVYTGTGTVEAEVVFVGYGISAKDRGWDDYDGLDVKGKIVLALRGAPTSRDAEFPVERQIGWKSSYAADHGAVGFLIAEGKPAIAGTIQEKFHRDALPALWVTSPLADRILAKQGRTLDDLKTSRDAGDPGRSFETGARVKMEVHGRFEPHATGRNALGGMNGRDPDLRGEVVIVGAHLDHIGVDAKGRVFNGADDDGSGSATLLHVLETLKKNRWRPKRTVVFVWFAGEEQGLVGSKHLVGDLPFPHQRIAAMINMDMVGQGKPEINLGGGEGYPDLYARAVAALPAEWKPKIHPFRVDPNSDHWPFYERGIPALFAHTAGDHPNYHQLTDDVENLKPECLEAAARVVGTIIVALCDAEGPLGGLGDVAGLVVREGPRVVEGPKSAAALATLLATPRADPVDRAPLANAGEACVVVTLDEAKEGAAVAWARLDQGLRAHPKDLLLVKTATDLVNAPKASRTGVLPRLACGTSVRAFPGVLSTYRAMGLRWVTPFEGAPVPTDAERDAILDAAVEAKLAVDLTGLPLASLPAVRARLKSHPATWRVRELAGADQAAQAAALGALRKDLGADTWLVVTGPAADLALSSDLWTAEAPKGLAPMLVAEEDTAHLVTLLTPADDGQVAAYADPASPARARLREAFGGSFADLLRRIP